MDDNIINDLLITFSNLSDKNKSNIQWMLRSFNPEPLEFYRYLNRKTKKIATNSYFSALSFILTLSERIPKERMALFHEIQEKWKNGVFNKDWSVYVAEKSASISVMACYNVQRSYNREVSSHSLKRKRDYPITPNKPIIQSEMKEMYPQVSFTKKVKVVVFEDGSKEVEPGKDGQKADEDGSDKDDLKAKITSEDELKGLGKDQKAFEEGSENDVNPFIAMDWHVWLERILEFSIEEARIKILTYNYTPANGFEEVMIKYIGKVLMDFINKIIDIPGHVMTIDEVERDWIVNKFLRSSLICKRRS